MMWTDDPVRDAARWQRQIDKLLETRPTCYACGEPIQEPFCYRVNGHKYCVECKDEAWRELRPHYLVPTDE